MLVDQTKLEPEIEYVKIHGLQRSGTNYIAYLINENYENCRSLINVGGWKHGHYKIPLTLEHEVHVLTIVKNPYSWLVSMYNYWKNKNIGQDLCGVPFKDFVKNRAIFERQKDVPYLFRAANPVQHWNNMNFHWCSILIDTKKLFILRYESLISNKEMCLNEISKLFSLKRKDVIQDCTNSMIPADELPKPSEQKWQKEFYDNRAYLDLYDQETFDFVNNQLDLDVMIAFRYEYEGVK